MSSLGRALGACLLVLGSAFACTSVDDPGDDGAAGAPPDKPDPEGGAGGADPTPEPSCVGRAEGPSAGNLCGCNDDCDGTDLCIDELTTGAPGGLCLRNCAAGAECEPETVCVMLEPGLGMCAPSCVDGSECPAGRYCTRYPDQSAPLACLPYCQSDAECPTLGHCDPYTGLCGDFGVHPGTADIGEPCETGNDCLSSKCLPEPGFPGGTCTADCSIVRQGCPGEATCVPVWDDEERGLCVASCQAHEDCREGYGCQDMDRIYFGVSQRRFACVPTEGECLEPAPSPSAGLPCGCDTDCDPGDLCLAEREAGLPLGLCARSCLDDDGCDEASACVSWSAGRSCLLLCDGAEDCGPGRACAARSGVMVCVPDCTIDEECPTLGTCDTRTGRCLAGG